MHQILAAPTTDTAKLSSPGSKAFFGSQVFTMMFGLFVWPAQSLYKKIRFDKAR